MRFRFVYCFVAANCLIVDRLKELYLPRPVAGDPSTQAQLPFPDWLRDFTGLKDWPGLDPPYIPLEFMKFDQIAAADAPIHIQGTCSAVKPNHCSFDCFNCITPDDVWSCPKLSQTFDDGPTIHTPKLLAKWKALGVKTTFFTLGVQAIKFPQIYRQAMADGHVMGSHTWSHKFLPSLTNEQIIAQLEWSIWAMNATGNHLPKWFRPPYGGLDTRVRSIVRQFGMQNALWDMDTFDWKMNSGRSESTLLLEVRTFKSVRGGRGMILEHDAWPNTVEAGLKVFDIVGPDQLTVPQCVGGINYIKEFAPVSARPS
jgi:chitin deacetylase